MSGQSVELWPERALSPRNKLAGCQKRVVGGYMLVFWFQSIGVLCKI